MSVRFRTVVLKADTLWGKSMLDFQRVMGLARELLIRWTCNVFVNYGQKDTFGRTAADDDAPGTAGCGSGAGHGRGGCRGPATDERRRGLEGR